MDALRVIVVDDHPLFRYGLKTVLSELPEIDVVGEAETGAAAVEVAATVLPDVVVMDLHLEDMNGIEATRQIVSTSPHIGVLVLTMFDDDESVFAAMRAGARGYLLKGSGQEEIVQAIQAVGRGVVIFSPGIAERVLRFFSGPGANRVGPFPELTVREREVLDLIARRENNATIAHRLGISPKTVRNHVSNIFSKLHVADRAQAIIRAREAGLGPTKE